MTKIKKSSQTEQTEYEDCPECGGAGGWGFNDPYASETCDGCTGTGLVIPVEGRKQDDDFDDSPDLTELIYGG